MAKKQESKVEAPVEATASEVQAAVNGTLKCRFVTGNFELNIEGMYSEENKAKALVNALKYEVQRTVASKTYLALAGEPGKKEGTLVLPEGFERDSIEFSPETAEKFLAAAKVQLAEMGTFTVTVSEKTASEDKAGVDALKRANEYLAKGEDFVKKVVAHIKSRCGYEIADPKSAESIAKGITALDRKIAAEIKEQKKSEIDSL